MDLSDRLASNLTAEAQAYGYTLTIWGAGALLVAAYGVPDPTAVFLYVSGALVGFGALAAVAFSGLFERRAPGEATLFVASMVHVAATVGNLVVSYLAVVAARRAGLPAGATFFLVGAQATATYNLLLLLEEYAVERVRWLEADETRDEPG